MDFASPESLPSEEWISQPRSSAPASIQGDSPGSTTSLGLKSQSRIPRPASLSASRSTFRIEAFQSNTAMDVQYPARRILSEKTLSELNICPPKDAPDVTILPKVRGISHHSRLTSRRSMAVTPVGSQKGTVQQKPRQITSSGKIGSEGPLDWRRRMLNGGNERAQQDLFSPIGLEHVFKPPTVNHHRKTEKSYSTHSKNSGPRTDTKLPSSPPSCQKSPPEDSLILSRASGIHAAKGDMVQLRQTSCQPPAQNKKISLNREKSVNCTQPAGAFGKRTVSSLSDARHERISPVQIALVNRLASPPMDALRPSVTKGMPRSASRSSDNEVDYRSLGSRQATHQVKSLADWTVHSLPESSIAGIDTLSPVSKYVNIHRGDHYIDLSFQRRSLSPSSNQHSSTTSTDIKNDWDWKDSGTNASARPGTGRKLVSTAPTTPGKVVKPPNTPEGPRSSGSPLKLFDKHDTFTNNRLARRISQFEGRVGIAHSAQDLNNNIPLDRPLDQEDSLARCPDIKRRRSPGTEDAKDIRHFGDGILDSYNFRRPCATRATSTKEEQGMDALSLDPKRNAANRSEAHDYMPFQRHMRSKQAGRMSTECPASDLPSTRGIECMEMLERRGDLVEASTKEHKDNKRSLVSPGRKPDSKRRRTVNSDAAMPNVLKSGLAYSQVFTGQPTHSTKPENARYDEHSQVMDSGVPKTRHILCLRNGTRRQTAVAQQSTSNSVRDDGGVNAVLDAKMHGNRQNDPKVFISTDHPPIAAMVGQLTDLAVEVAGDAAYGDRKVSVTTADFTNAANLIMQNIRAQARPPLGRGESENTDPVPLNVIDEMCHEGSTVEILSRPPSREGRLLDNPRKLKQLDPRVISHLRKYEEKDDLCMATSLPDSFGAADGDGSSATSSSHNGITDPRSIHEGESCGAESVDSALVKSSNSNDRPEDFCYSLPSSQSSTGASLPTGTSSGSGNKAVIGPEKVSHLISDHVAGMTYDHASQSWVRKKSIIEDRERIPDVDSHDITEEDPLRGIPDLSVDEVEEMRQIQPLVSNAQASSYKAPEESTVMIGDLNGVKCNGPASSTESITQRIASPCSLPGQSSSLHFQRPPHDHQVKKELEISRLDNHQEMMHECLSSVTEPDFQQNFHKPESDLKARVTKRFPCSTSHGPQKEGRQARVVTVAFSSPLASHILHSASSPSERISEEMSEHCERDVMSSSGVAAKLNKSKKISRSYRKQLNDRSQCGISNHGHKYLVRSITRIDEQEEFSIVHQPGTENSLELGATFSSPRASQDFRGTNCPWPSAKCQQSDATFSLSPLSDFTLHQTDERPSSNKACSIACQGLLDPHSLDESFPIVVQDLVTKITDVEPYDPYWENIRTLDLKSKGLVTLLKLEDFCMRIEELDVSNNVLTHLDGAPRTVRVMRAPGNCLSGLTGWGHLQNLQYLDVSDNHLDSLEGLNELVHLRELKADNNHIKSLSGVTCLNGLLRLRLRGNDFETLDLQASDL